MTAVLSSVREVLRTQPGLRSKEIAALTGIKPRTVRHALKQLGNLGAVDSRFSLKDTRHRRYFLKEMRNAKVN